MYHITCESYMEHYHNGIMPIDETKLHKAQLQYKDKMYLQNHSLAMGVVYSLDLTNLYG